MSAKPRCDEITCFQNRTGKLCDLLTKHQSKPCPFFKTQEQVDAERLEAHEKLKREGKTDLIIKYEYNPYRRGQW